MVEIHSYEPLPKQKLFHQAKQKRKFYVGAYGAGKSKALIWEAIDLCMKFPKNVFLIARKYNEDLPDTTMKMFFDECPQGLIKKAYNSGRNVELINGSEILFFGLYTKQKARLSKVGSLNLGGYGIDEASETSADDYKLLNGRLRLDRVGERYGIIVTNPPNVDHWIHDKGKMGAQAHPEFVFHIQASCYDNPYLPEDYITNLVAEYPPSWIKRYVDGEYGFAIQGDPVYSGFDEKRHIMELTYDSNRPIYRSWDFGWHRPAVAFCQVDEKGRFKVLRELIGNKTYLEDWAPKVIYQTNIWFPNCQIEDFCDIAGKQKHGESKQTAIDILKKYKVNPRYRYSYIERGIEVIQRKINTNIEGIPAFIIDKTCENAKDGFLGGYYRARDKNGIPEIEPYKDGFYDHIQDCIRYIVVNLFTNFSSTKDKDIKITQPSFFTSSQAGAYGQR